MWKSSLLVGVALTLCLSCVKATEPPKPAETEPTTDDQKTLYALGLAISSNLAVFNLTQGELDMVKSGLTDGILKKTPKVAMDTFGPKIQVLAQSRIEASAAAEKKASEAFLQKAATEPGASKSATGMIYTVIKAGTGESPKPTDKVKVHYTGKLIDGVVVDSSVQRGTPAELSLNQMMPCWVEGLQLMKVGGKSKLVCPSEIAYGDQGRPPTIKPGATLVFEVELLDILK
jgi:FKBP-type peptidyl-prolyl cis-trans isomerase FkpA/FKBP-type peptidyl-prolyl cis-trans isomerase FklB